MISTTIGAPDITFTLFVVAVTAAAELTDLAVLTVSSYVAQALTVEAPYDTGCSFSFYCTPFVVNNNGTIAELIC